MHVLARLALGVVIRGAAVVLLTVADLDGILLDRGLLLALIRVSAHLTARLARLGLLSLPWVEQLVEVESLQNVLGFRAVSLCPRHHALLTRLRGRVVVLLFLWRNARAHLVCVGRVHDLQIRKVDILPLHILVFRGAALLLGG